MIPKQTRLGLSPNPPDAETASHADAAIRWAVVGESTNLRDRMARSAKTFDLRARTAHHEAGHAVLSVAINDHPEHVSIRGHGETLGRSAQKMLGRPTSLAQVYLAGFAAEHLLTGRRPQAFGVEVGLGVLAHLDPKLVDTIEGVDATDGYGAVHQLLRSGVREVEDEIRTEVERLYGVARESLRAVRPSVRTVAEALLEREELNRAAASSSPKARSPCSNSSRICPSNGRRCRRSSGS